MARFSLIFSGKTHSDPITWCKSKVRSWIWCFLSFRFRWYPFRTTRRKDPLKVVKSLQFCHAFKTTMYKCVMWPGILRDARCHGRFSQRKAITNLRWSVSLNISDKVTVEPIKAYLMFPGYKADKVEVSIFNFYSCFTTRCKLLFFLSPFL